MIENWGNSALTLNFGMSPEGRVLLLGLNEVTGSTAALPLVEVEATGHGRVGTSGKRHVDSAVGARLAYERHEAADGHLAVHLHDPVSDLRAVVHYALTAELPVLRCWTELTAGAGPARIESVSSFVLGGAAALLGAPTGWERRISLFRAANPWSGEYRWQGTPLADAGLVDVGMTRFGQTGSKNRLTMTSTGSWPSSELLPMAWMEGPSCVLAWQVDHNGSWHAELADRHDDLYVLLAGPTGREHGWSLSLSPGETFTSVTATVAVAADRDSVLAALTGHRRALRRPHRDNAELPVVFNDFMNCLMGDPSTGALLPLVTAASAVGAEYFCIDAGWFDDEHAADGPGGVPGWWDAVGEWRPAPSRFPGGLAEVTGAVRTGGMVPGLWLEPEVIGVRSPLARSLPDEAFFRRDGRRITEWGRHQLDFSHPAAVAHLDAVVDRLIADFGIGYFKLDYNIDIGAGTDAGPHGPGHGLLEHNRGYLRWLDAVQDRHPGVVLEACAAGGMRVDHATLSRVAVQSLTDQQDERLIPAVAAGAPAMVPPEQGAVWAYPHAGQSDAEIVFTMVSAMLARIHLSGRLDLLTEHQRALVAEAVAVYRTFRASLATAVPSWPLGPAAWRDEWLALALSTDTETFLAVWRRGGSRTSCSVPLPAAAAAAVTLFGPPAAEVELDAAGTGLTVTLPDVFSAALFRTTRAVRQATARPRSGFR